MDSSFASLPDISLPVFRAFQPGQALYYTPGYLVGVPHKSMDEFDRQLAQEIEHGNKPHLPLDKKIAFSTEAAQSLAQAALFVERAWEIHLSKPFTPVCLTLYPHNECNLACPYCFSHANTAQQRAPLSLNALRVAAQVVAENCLHENQPMTVVFHGGGEPALDLSWVMQALKEVESIAFDHKIDLIKYIATNGVMSERKAGWLAEHFDLIGLSCDGPEDIQTAQRPLRNGKSSFPFVEQTARIIRQAGKPLHVRVTITPATFHRQSEIAEYLCGQIRPHEIHVESLYRGNRIQKGSFEPDDASGFVEEFFNAREICRAYHISWRTSGSRLDELHGPYCQIHRSVLQLVPGDCATACYEICDINQARQNGLLIGASNHDFNLDADTIYRLGNKLGTIPASCADCFNRFHCNRACPDVCGLTDRSPKGSFRCRVNSQIAEGLLFEQASLASGNEVWLLRLVHHSRL